MGRHCIVKFISFSCIKHVNVYLLSLIFVPLELHQWCNGYCAHPPV